MNTIMTVCIGNICRSPVAEGLLKLHLPKKTIISAGLGALVGKKAANEVLEIAEKDGLNIENHRAQQITSYLCKKADLILVMEEFQQKEIEEKFPFTKGKVHRLGKDKNGYFDISDPYKKNYKAYLDSHNKIKLGVENWVSILKNL